jgi:predicted regulator of Ras-like GTPase activity (Roadblock/LC7/MglB family)
MMSASGATSNPGDEFSGPQEFTWLIDTFVQEVPGVTDALVMASDGLLLVTSGEVTPEVGEQLAAISSGLLSLGHNSAVLVGRGTCEQIMLRLSRGHLLFMRIGETAGIAVLTSVGCDLKVVAFEMAQLVQRVGHALTPQARRQLQHLAASRAVRG